MGKYIIGIDMGINNVGWSVLDCEKNLIEKSGVRLFSISSDAKDRRMARNVRRRMKRRSTRVHDILELFGQIHFPKEVTIDSELIKTRYKGIKQQISKQNIINILCFLIKYRGYIPYGDEEVNFVDLKDKLPCEYYYDLYQKTGKYRATNEQVKNNENIKEIEKMLLVQSRFYSEINSNIIQKTIDIFKRKRTFWEGPGSVKQLTPYGRFKTIDDVQDYLKRKKQNQSYEKYIFEDLIGNCKIALDQKCASALNFYAEQFNLLNDFINIKIKNIEDVNQKDYFTQVGCTYTFNKEALELIVQYCLDNDTISVKNMFKKLFGLDIINTSGYRVDKKNNPEFATLNHYRYVKKTMLESGFSLDWVINHDTYNKIINYFMITPGTVELIKMISNDKSIQYNFSEDEYTVLSTIYTKLKKSSAFKYHALSEKVLKIAIHDMLATQMNFMQVRKKFDYDKEAREWFAKHYCNVDASIPLINSKYVDEIIASPQVKKSLRQAIRVINSIIKAKKSIPEIIAIESTREMNGKDKKNELQREQLLNEKIKQRAVETIQNLFGEKQLNDANIEKVMLYEEINGICPYCNKVQIKLDDVINNKIEVEHILPRSQSFNNSYNNKTLSCPKCNSEKSNKTPYSYLSPFKKYDDFSKRINENKNYSDDKKANFLFTGDLNKYSTRFFARNLRDTAYATTELIKQIKLFNYYLEDQYNDVKVLTLSTPGMITHETRKRLNIEKDRDDGKHHHAVDASIVALLGNTKLGRLIVQTQNDNQFWIKGKEFIEKNPNMLYKFNLNEYKNQILDINEENIKLSYEVNKDPEKKLSNANIYKYIKKGENYYKIEQISNIYAIDFNNNASKKQFEKLIDDNNNNIILLCFDNNKKLYQKIKDIYNKYKNKKGNVFINYAIDKYGLQDVKDFDYRKHGLRNSLKKTDSPVIIRLRYYSKASTPYLLDKKNIKQKENTLIGLDSLGQYCTQIYEDLDNKKFVFLPIFALSVDLHSKRINKDNFYYKLLYQKYIGTKNIKYICSLYNGNYLEITKKTDKIISGVYQCFHKTNNKICLKNGAYFTQNDLVLKIYDIDMLGNKKERLTYSLK